jgi:poly-gamma-glutamate biosynthesis protein PgsC/CapC
VLIHVQQTYVALGIVQSLLMSEFFGISAGGIIVPGYLALNLNNPLSICVTFLVSLMTFYSIRLLQQLAVIYGKRKNSLMILMGFLIGMFVERYVVIEGNNFNVIGHLIPGLIAISYDRQGIIPTISMALLSSIVVRIICLIILN